MTYFYAACQCVLLFLVLAVIPPVFEFYEVTLTQVSPFYALLLVAT